MWIFLALILVPIIEIALFIQVGGWLTLWPTLGLVVLTAVLGTWILRIQGTQAMADLRQSINTLDDPTTPLAHGAMILVSGVLLLTPGFMTDAFGFALLVPAVRTFLLTRIKDRVRIIHPNSGRPMGDIRSNGARSSGTRPKDRVIDAEFEEVDPENTPTRSQATHKPSGWTKH